MTTVTTMFPQLRNTARALRSISPRKIAQNFAVKSAEDKLLLLGGLTYVPSALLTPITTKLQLRHAKPAVPHDDQKLLVKVEVLRQAVSAGLWFLSYYGGIALFGKALSHTKSKSMLQFIGGTILATITNGLLKPLITNQLFIKGFYKDRPPVKPQNTPTLHHIRPSFSRAPAFNPFLGANPFASQ